VLRHSEEEFMNTIALRPWESAAYMREKKLLVVRPVKPQPFEQPELFSDGRWHAPWDNDKAPDDRYGIKCPFGKPGEVLGLKEPFQIYDYCPGEYGGTGELGYPCTKIPKENNGGWCPIYRADDESDGPWRPAQHMPLWAIRHRPTIADIRVMRVGEMSEEDAQATGMRSFTKDGRLHKFWFCDPVEDNPPKSLRVSWADMPHTATEAFKALWNKHYPTLSWGWGIFLEGT
jgi:hypothetical protein